MSAVEYAQVIKYLEPILNNTYVQQMKNYVQHGSISTYDHCLRVACLSYIAARRMRMNIDMRTLVTGAFLHDFYLYDWHNHKRDGLPHGFTHPKTASLNARRLLGLSNDAAAIIETHMWPLTITKLPRSRAALIVCIADKFCAVSETVRGIVNIQ
jgi:uncharacterized protein